MLQNHLTLFGGIFNLAEFLGSVVVHFNKSKRSMELPTNYSKKQRGKSLLQAILISFFLVGAFYKITCFKNDITIGDIVLFSFGATCLPITNIYIHVYRNKASVICLYLNGLLDFPNNFPSSQQFPIPRKSLVRKLNSLFPYLLCFSLLSVPVVYVWGIHWFNPCKPAIALHLLIPECWKVSEISAHYPSPVFQTMLKIGVLSVNYWMWIYGPSVTVVGFCIFKTMCITAIREYLDKYKYYQFIMMDFRNAK